MKETGMCPKCEGTDIIRIPGTLGAYGAGNNIPAGWFSAVMVTRLVCGQCGFSEEWIDRAADIELLRKKYAK